MKNIMACNMQHRCLHQPFAAVRCRHAADAVTLWRMCSLLFSQHWHRLCQCVRGRGGGGGGGGGITSIHWGQGRWFILLDRMWSWATILKYCYFTPAKQLIYVTIYDLFCCTVAFHIDGVTVVSMIASGRSLNFKCLKTTAATRGSTSMWHNWYT